MVQLHRGSLLKISKGTNISSPILQVKELSHVNSKTGGTRIKLVISDGECYHTGVLAGSLNYMVEDSSLRKNTVFVMEDYIYKSITQNAAVFIISEAKVVTQERELIGNPVPMESAVAGGNAGAGESPKPVNNSQKRVYAVEKSSADAATLTPIRGLNPYSSKWTIQCRVISKSTIRTWDKGPNNQGKLFSVDLLDSESSEIRATFFRDAVDKFYDFLEKDSVYKFSNGQVKIANKRFNTTKCDYEITFSASAEIAKVEFDENIKSVNVDRTLLNDVVAPERNEPAFNRPGNDRRMNNAPANAFTNSVALNVDVVGVLVSWGNVETFTSKAGREVTKLDVVIADESNCQMRCTVFGEKCAEMEEIISRVNSDTSSPMILAFKGAKVSDFDGISLTISSTTSIYVNPEIKEARGLQNWLASGVDLSSLVQKSQSKSGSAQNSPSNSNIAERVSLKQLNNLMNSLQLSDKAEYFTVKANVAFIKKDPLWYASCPEPGNNKKVIQQPNGTFFCEATGQSFETCEYRFISTILLSDFSDSKWVSAFNDTAELILGHSANELQELRQNNEEMFEDIMSKVMFEEFVFRLRVRNEVYNEEMRPRINIVSAEKVDFVKENKMLLEFINLAAH